ncbi:MAG TPA: 4Fe-4S dicluster domain-containing protein [Methylomirabilota bacterium]|jgi:molybdopterin-containing oxidoreductase family iron-sulfur binding subunit|nr:4Fe-4S dicluster domain-containing protein [Methylomirabilota bacterium]
MADNDAERQQSAGVSRRAVLKTGGLLGAVAALAGAGAAVAEAEKVAQGGGSVLADAFGSFFQRHYKKMGREEIRAAIARIERRAKRRHDATITVGNEPPPDGVVFGYAINISKCKGTRRCVDACIAENNMGRESGIQYIRVLQLDQGELDLDRSEHYYDAEVPKEGKYYLPVQCMQCDNPPCVRACPVEATWTERDGIVVVDYDWCIGCRYCMAACPYWARHFNWTAPALPRDEINADTHYLGNRPRPAGVVEKCTFCIQRSRKGRLPACLEACPTGARVFGNLLDPKSDIRYVLENKTVFRLKEDLKTEPKFWYYTD